MNILLFFAVRLVFSTLRASTECVLIICTCLFNRIGGLACLSFFSWSVKIKMFEMKFFASSSLSNAVFFWCRWCIHRTKKKKSVALQYQLAKVLFGIYEWYILSANAFATMHTFHGTGTVKRVDSVMYMEIRNRAKAILHSQSHPHHQQQQENVYLRRPMNRMLNAYRNFCHLIFKRIYFARQFKFNRIFGVPKKCSLWSTLKKRKRKKSCVHVLY